MIDWHAVSAIGSLLAVVVALFIALFGSWARNKIFGPNVSIEFDRGWPFTGRTDRTWVPRQPGSHELQDIGPSFWIRVRIHNTGKSTARHCKVKLLKVRYEGGKKALERFDPVILRWVSPPSGPEQFKPLDILPDETELCNVLSLVQADAEPVAWVECDREPRGTVTAPNFKEHANYWLDVVVFGENFKPVYKTLEVEGTGYWAQDSYLPVLQARQSTKSVE